ncbi:MAG: tail fiber domain-containing protein, partial [Candidatus Fonsibacter sp.]
IGSSNFHFSVWGSGERLRLTPSGVSVFGTFTNSSDKRLKFNVKPLTNALDVINRLEPVEYDQTYTLVDDYTPETPQSHQSGLIAQSVHTIDELKHAVEGGEVGEDGVESIRTLNYNAVFTYAVKAIQELHEIVKQQQIQIDLQKQQIDKLINIILTS